MTISRGNLIFVSISLTGSDKGEKKCIQNFYRETSWKAITLTAEIERGI
jgi:hypothetical protein